MDHLPKNDAAMLVSSINFLLRDGEFEDLDGICDYYNENRVELEAGLKAEGYLYSKEQKKFI